MSAKKQTQQDFELPNPVALSQALMQAYQDAQPILQDFMQNYLKDMEESNYDPFHVRDAYADFLQQWMNDPAQAMEIQSEYWQKWTQLWQESARGFMDGQFGAEQSGAKAPSFAAENPRDRRFRAPEWQESALFNFIKQSYLLTCEAMNRTVHEAKGLDESERKKLEFVTNLFANALSPSNFVMTNPEVLKETMATGGQNLVNGFENLIEDLKRGHGELAISTTDYNAFTPGENLACTPGRVVYENDLMQLIQYEPTTDKVFQKPLLIVPPWINKYYILDLKAEKSFVKWATEQGHNVFMISWVNPDDTLAQKRFEDYMSEGVLAALDEIQKITDEPQANVVSYCLGGTLMNITLAYLAAKGKEDRIASATCLTTLLDFEHAGEMKLFMDEEQIKLLDRHMAESGVLQGRHLQKTFSLLRANDMIWSFVVNNYLMGKEPFPFDLLYWNDDVTNMPAAMHSFYLRKFYRDNALVQPGGVTMHGTPIDIRKIATPRYFLSTREDHIAPWRATFEGAQHGQNEDGGAVEFVLAASGHTAGVVNHPDKKKYCYWTAKMAKTADDFIDGATEHDGSWWPHWQKWAKNYAGTKVAARKPAKGIEAAPGRYVRVRSV